MDDEIYKNGGYFDDNGNKLDPDIIPKPGLCLVCANEDNPHELVLCNLNRLDQVGEDEFKCGSFEPKA